jgi:hypothetical protein
MPIESTSTTRNPLDFAFFDLDQEQSDMDSLFAKDNQTFVSVRSVSLINQEQSDMGSLFAKDNQTFVSVRGVSLINQKQPDMDLSFAKVNQTCVSVEGISITNQEPCYIYTIKGWLLYVYLESTNKRYLWHSKDYIRNMLNYLKINTAINVPKQDINSAALPINYKDIISGSIKSFGNSNIMNVMDVVQDAEKKEEELKSNIINAFKQIDEVESIYVQRYTYEWKIIILLNNKRYDDELMDRLLDIEYDLQNRDEDPLLDFSYIPKIYNNKWDILHPSSLLIYER